MSYIAAMQGPVPHGFIFMGTAMSTFSVEERGPQAPTIRTTPARLTSPAIRSPERLSIPVCLHSRSPEAGLRLSAEDGSYRIAVGPDGRA
jgi:hypothetical protein